MSYEVYKQLITDLLAEGKSTSPEPSTDLAHYSQLNMQRMHRVEKTILITPEVRVAFARPLPSQYWLVLTEGWCGDAAQSIPVMVALAKLNPAIRVGFLLRDQNLELMDQYLTNGVSRSIPRLIALHPLSGEELFTWGPRPAPLQEAFYKMKEEGVEYHLMKEELQRWYNKDRTLTIQEEFTTLVKALS